MSSQIFTFIQKLLMSIDIKLYYHCDSHNMYIFILNINLEMCIDEISRIGELFQNMEFLTRKIVEKK